MRSLLFALACVSLLACGDDGGPVTIDAPADTGVGDIDAPLVDAPLVIDAPPGAFALTSTAITEGGVIPDMYSCQGTNVSPPLVWTGGPAAPGYAIVFTDMSNGLIHSIIWDIPGATMALPENVEKVYMPPVPAGSKQPLAYNNTTRGYLGPCPDSMHTYQFALYAVDVNPLPGLAMQSTRTQVRTAILDHDTATATLTATFTP